jgi:hypothetical protein
MSPTFLQQSVMLDNGVGRSILFQCRFICRLSPGDVFSWVRWQTLWYGPWLLDGILDGAGDVSEHLPVLLEEHQHRWLGRAS